MSVDTFEPRGPDQAKWGEGPWQKEPDRLEWERHGLPCLIVRNPMGALCGYVAVPPGHPWHGIGYSDCAKKPQCKKSKIEHTCAHSPESLIHVHGGLTYSNFCAGHICHDPMPGKPDDVFWFGFDCAHGQDVIPSMNAIPGITMMTSQSLFGETYKDVDYVTGEVNHLANQLAKVK